MSSEEHFEWLNQRRSGMLSERIEPGPRERSWWARLHFRVFGVWPRSVVEERLEQLEKDRPKPKEPSRAS